MIYFHYRCEALAREFAVDGFSCNVSGSAGLIVGDLGASEAESQEASTELALEYGI